MLDMVQTKKDDVRISILESARAEFEKNGYAHSTIRGIARRAGMSASNLYVYFSSKLDLLFAIYGPWMRHRITGLEAKAQTVADPRRRLHLIVSTLWKDIPATDDALCNIFIEGLAVSGREGTYSRELLIWAEERVATMIAGCLPSDRAKHFGDTALAHVLFMAFDGFAVNHVLVGPSKRLERCIDITVDMILGSDAQQTPRVTVAE